MTSLFPLLAGFLAASAAGPPFAVPVPFPTAPTACEYEGVFPGSGAAGRWNLRTRDGGEWELTPESPDLLRGIVARHVGERPFTVLEGILRGTETRSGSITRTREVLEAIVEVEGTRATIRETAERESACPGTPMAAPVGASWRCLESTTVTTTSEGVAVERPQGAVRNRADESWTRLPDAVEGDRTLLMLEVRSEDRHERIALDPAAPWCPVRSERLIAGHVVGTDRLVGTVQKPERHLPGREHGNITLPRFGMMLIAGAVILLAIAFGMAGLAGRYARRTEKKA